MSYYKEFLEKEGKLLNLELESLPVCISLVTGLYFTNCFIEYETDDFLICNVTRPDGCEELHVFPKNNIEYVKIQYAPMEVDEDEINGIYS